MVFYYTDKTNSSFYNKNFVYEQKVLGSTTMMIILKIMINVINLYNFLYFLTINVNKKLHFSV